MLNESDKKALLMEAPIRSTDAAASEDAHDLLLDLLRHRLARDLHDQIGWHLVALNYGLRDAEARLGRSEELHELRRRLDDFAAALRGLTTRFEDGAPSPAPFPKQVSDLCADWTQITGVPVALQFDTMAPGLGPEVADAMIGILREALTNTARHAAAIRVAVRIEPLMQGAIRLSIEDVVPEAASGSARRLPQEGQGIAGMRRRVEEVGGRLAYALGESGLRLVVEIPRMRRK